MGSFMLNADHCGSWWNFAVSSLLEGATDRSGQSSCKLVGTVDVDGQIVFFGSACENEWMIVKDGDFRTAEEDALCSACQR